MVFGSGLTARIWYPYFEMVRYISVLEFLQNVEIIVTVVWLLSVFIKLSTFLFITTHSLGQLFGLKDSRKLIWFVALAMIPLSLIYRNIDIATIEFPKKIFIPFMLPINMIGTPMLLLIIGTIRKNRKERQGQVEMGR
jgi:spore germination protein KB